MLRGSGAAGPGGAEGALRARARPRGHRHGPRGCPKTAAGLRRSPPTEPGYSSPRQRGARARREEGSRPGRSSRSPPVSRPLAAGRGRARGDRVLGVSSAGPESWRPVLAALAAYAASMGGLPCCPHSAPFSEGSRVLRHPSGGVSEGTVTVLRLKLRWRINLRQSVACFIGGIMRCGGCSGGDGLAQQVTSHPVFSVY